MEFRKKDKKRLTFDEHKIQESKKGQQKKEGIDNVTEPREYFYHNFIQIHKMENSARKEEKKVYVRLACVKHIAEVA